MTIQATVTIWCDKCGGPQFSYTPDPFGNVNSAMAACEAEAVEASRKITARGQHICPACVSLEQHPAEWTKEAGPNE